MFEMTNKMFEELALEWWDNNHSQESDLRWILKFKADQIHKLCNT